MSPEPRVETFEALRKLPWIRHGFTVRVNGLDVNADRDAALERLDRYHSDARRFAGMGEIPFIFGEQVHGNAIAIANRFAAVPVPGVDGLITAEEDVCLGIYVADCCAVFLVDPDRHVIGLLHSGRKGTELGIASRAIGLMAERFGCEPARFIVQLSPCIRPPFYEVDFAAEIVRQCRASGVQQIFDCGVCTAGHLDRYYSYRAEHGKTGRMLAMLSLTS